MLIYQKISAQSNLPVDLKILPCPQSAFHDGDKVEASRFRGNRICRGIPNKHRFGRRYSEVLKRLNKNARIRFVEFGIFLVVLGFYRGAQRV